MKWCNVGCEYIVQGALPFVVGRKKLKNVMLYVKLKPTKFVHKKLKRINNCHLVFLVLSLEVKDLLTSCLPVIATLVIS